MRSSTLIFALVVAVVMAEQYAMIFGTCDGWGNYSITSVFQFNILFTHRNHVALGMN